MTLNKKTTNQPIFFSFISFHHSFSCFLPLKSSTTLIFALYLSCYVMKIFCLFLLSLLIRPRGPLRWLDPGAFGTLGVGGGFALGAKICRPDSEVWIIYGDGSLGFSVAEFDTFTRHKVNNTLPFLFFFFPFFLKSITFFTLKNRYVYTRTHTHRVIFYQI